jgi:hypothetical protein
MLYRSAGGLALVLMVGGLLLAEETRGTITKIEDGSITVRTGGGFGNNKTESVEKTFKIAKDAKIVRAAGKDRDEVKLTLDEVKTAVKVTNVFVTVTHEGDNGSEIKVGGFGGGFGRKKKDNK